MYLELIQRMSSTKSAQIIALGSNLALPGGGEGGDHKFYMGLYRENFRNLPVPSHKA